MAFRYAELRPDWLRGWPELQDGQSFQSPPAFHGQAAPEPDSLADLAWWDAYPDPALGALIKEALTNNNDLLTAIARVEQARDFVAVARSEYYPVVGYGAGTQRDKRSL